MIYDGTLTMPANFAALDEEEMTYTEGGSILCDESYQYCRSGYEAAAICHRASGQLTGVYLGCITVVACIGALAGTAVSPGWGSLLGAIAGGFVGALASDVFKDWAHEWDYAYWDALDKGSRPCVVHWRQHYLTTRVTIE